MNTFILCTAVLLLMYTYLSVRVSLKRDGSAPEPELNRYVRAHGNASEYLPVFILAFLFFHSSASYVLMGTALIATLSRLSHAYGMLHPTNEGQHNHWRYYGAVGTYLGLFGFAIAFALEGLAILKLS